VDFRSAARIPRWRSIAIQNINLFFNHKP